MRFINSEINLKLTWYENCILSSEIEETKLAITDTKIYVPVVTLSIQDNAKLLEQLKFGFKRTNNWIKYHSKVSIERKNQYLNFLIHPSFQGVYRESLAYRLKLRTITRRIFSSKSKNKRLSCYDKWKKLQPKWINQ